MTTNHIILESAIGAAELSLHVLSEMFRLGA